MESHHPDDICFASPKAVSLCEPRGGLCPVAQMPCKCSFGETNSEATPRSFQSLQCHGHIFETFLQLIFSGTSCFIGGVMNSYSSFILLTLKGISYRGHEMYPPFAGFERSK